MVSMLMLCACNRTGTQDLATLVVRMQPEDRQPSTYTGTLVERPWQSTEWNVHRRNEARPWQITVTILEADGGELAAYTLAVKHSQIQGTREIEVGSANQVMLTLDQPGMAMTFASEVGVDGKVVMPPSGVCRITFAKDFLVAAGKAEPNAEMVWLFQLGLLGASADDIRAYDATPLRPNLAAMALLKWEHVSPEEIITYYRAGMPWTPEELIELRRAGIDPPYPIGMKDSGLTASVEQHILMHKTGVTPKDVAMYRAAGYVLTPEQLVQLHRQGVKAEAVLAIQTAGYDFTIEEMVKFTRWQVPPEFIVGLMQPGFQPLSSDQIVDLHLRRVTLEMVQAVRQPGSPLTQVLAIPRETLPRDPRLESGTENAIIVPATSDSTPLRPEDVDILRRALE